MAGLGVTGGAQPALPPGKLRPAISDHVTASRRLSRFLQARPGSVVLVHAAAGYGKTTALAGTQSPDWIWYNLDSADRSPLVLAARLCATLCLEPLPGNLPPRGAPIAHELAIRLQGRTLTITLDNGQQLRDAPEAGRLLAELLELVPGLGLRVGTRTRPPLPLARLQLDGRLVDVGPAELRLPAEEIVALLSQKLGRWPKPGELDLGDRLLGGWPSAMHLWLAGMDGDDVDPLSPLRRDKPLHDYLHEELLVGTLPLDAIARLWVDLSWLVGRGALHQLASTVERQRVIESLIRERVGVVPGRGGWHLHPLVRAFFAMHVSQQSPYHPARLYSPPSLELAWVPDKSSIAIRALGALRVEVAGQEVSESTWPTPARRLFELLLCMPSYQVSAQQAAVMLWPRHLSRSSLNSLNVALHGLRRILEPDLKAGTDSHYVVREGRSYRLRVESLSCDLEDFIKLLQQVGPELDGEGARRLEMAAALYRGEFLESSRADFVLERRARLRRQILEGLERLGAWHAHNGSYAGATRALGQLLELAPYREDMWARMLELHLAAGDEYGALAALQQCEQSLKAAGVEPSGLLKELHRRVRRETPAVESQYGT
jgi:DNA-binding SARP family transcriptional activator